MKRLTMEEISRALDVNLGSIPEWPIIGVFRRGIIPATMLALKRGVEVHGVYPRNFNTIVHEKFILVDDVVAQGRTLKAIRKCFPSCFFLSVVQDVSAEIKPDLALFTESEWIAFPWEDEDKVVPGDRGFFRDGTSVYGEGE